MAGGDEEVPLLHENRTCSGVAVGADPPSMSKKVWMESKKLWRIAGPAIFTRLSTYTTVVITQALTGHLGDLELAAFSIANTVVVGFNLGLMLGMASALETLCGQAYGAGRHHMLSIHLQRSWAVLLLFATALSPLYFLAEPALRWTGQPDELAALAGRAALWSLPLHFCLAVMFPLNRFLQCQLKNFVVAAAAAAGLVAHLCACWVFLWWWKMGLFGAVMALNFSWWFTVACLFAYVVGGGCPQSWRGFDFRAFSGLWDFFKLSAASGVMLCLENWYYRILILLTGTLKNAEVVVGALSICMNIIGWELMIQLAFFAAIGVRVANELGADNGNGARFATAVSVAYSTAISLIFCGLIVGFREKIALIFTTSPAVLEAVGSLSPLLAIAILLNSVQPILSGVAVGSGWQAVVAYVNVGCYYLIGIPLGVALGWEFDLGVQGIWAGMLGGTAVQTLILVFMTIRCNWNNEAIKARLRLDKWGDGAVTS